MRSSQCGPPTTPYCSTGPSLSRGSALAGRRVAGWGLRSRWGTFHFHSSIYRDMIRVPCTPLVTPKSKAVVLFNRIWSRFGLTFASDSERDVRPILAALLQGISRPEHAQLWCLPAFQCFAGISAARSASFQSRACPDPDPVLRRTVKDQD